MKSKKLMFLVAILIICLPGIAQAKQIIMQAGNVTIIREENGSIEVDTGNTKMSVPQQSIESEIEDDYSIFDAERDSSNSRQIIPNSGCGTRSVQSTHQSNHNGSKQTVTQTDISTNNICQ